MIKLKHFCSVTYLLVMVLTSAYTQNQNWTGWRGANRDATVVSFNAPSTWPAELTKVWQSEAGLGDGSALFVDGHLIIHVKQDSLEVALCMNAKNGDNIWSTVLNKSPKMTGGPSRNPGTRSTPGFFDGKILLLGAGGVLSCVDAESGDIIWQEKSYTEVPPFFTAASPLIIENKCIVHMGGHENGSIVAFNIENGKEVWSIDKPSTYSSAVTMKVDKSEIIVLQSAKELMGISFEGELLWSVETPAENRYYSSVTPVVYGNNVISTGQGKGFKSYTIEKSGNDYSISENWHNDAVNVNYNTPVYKNGYLYAHEGLRGRLFCLDAKTGKTCWNDSIPYNRFVTSLDLGVVLMSLSASGDLIFFEPDHESYTEVVKYGVPKVLSNAYPVVVGNRIYIKEKEIVSCWEIK